MMGKRLVVIGGTAAGLSAASKAKRLAPEMEVVVYERSAFVSYGSCGFPYYIGGSIHSPDDLISLTPQQLSQKRDIKTFARHSVTSIDRAGKTVLVTNLETGAEHRTSYDFLVIATGASAILPPVPGREADGVFTLRKMEDAIAIKDHVAAGGKRAVIIGAGFIGLELAEQLCEAGVRVHLADALPRLLPFFSQEYAELAREQLESRGIDVICGVTAREIQTDGGKAKGVALSDGRVIPCDAVIFAVGIAPESGLAGDCGLALGVKGSIVVDDAQQTGDPSIWACGDCAQSRNILTGKPCYMPLGSVANKQGRVAGAVIGGEPDAFPGVLQSQATKVFDLYIAATGLSLEQAEAEGFGADSVSIIKSDRASYYPGGEENRITLVYEKRLGRLLGAQGVGSISVVGRMNLLVAAITAEMTVERLNQLDLLYTPSVAPVYDPLLIAASQAVKKWRRESENAK